VTAAVTKLMVVAMAVASRLSRLSARNVDPVELDSNACAEGTAQAAL
jgi:hypothetical protein